MIFDWFRWLPCCHRTPSPPNSRMCREKKRQKTSNSAEVSVLFSLRLSVAYLWIIGEKQCPEIETQKWCVLIFILNVKGGKLPWILRWKWLKGRVSQQKKIKKEFSPKEKKNKTKGKRLKETSLLQSDCQGIVHIANTLWSWKLCIFSLCQVGKRDIPCGRFSHIELFKKKKKSYISRLPSLVTFLLKNSWHRAQILFPTPDFL